MSDYDGTILFKEWLPDLPELGNPGLTEAKNVLPMEGRYKAFQPINATGGSINGDAVAGYVARMSGDQEIILFVNDTAGSAGRFYRAAVDTFLSASTAIAASDAMSFDQYDKLTIATSLQTSVRYQTTGSGSDFVLLSGPPAAQHIGVVNQFVVLGQFANTSTTGSNRVRWSAIDSPLDWPSPNSATAIATQSGEQEFSFQHGFVTGISSGDQHGLVFQEHGVTRMTYVGPPAVFQFDLIDNRRGAYFEYGHIKVGELTYFLSFEGFCVTDGVTVKDISDQKIWRAFRDQVSVSLFVDYRKKLRVGSDPDRKLIFWSYPSSGAALGAPDKMIIYNYQENRWSRADQAVDFIFGSSRLLSSNSIVAGTSTQWPQAPFGVTGRKLGTFSGSAGTATLTTGELEPNAGGYSVMQGVKPLVDQTLNGITVAIGSRNDRSSAVSYTAEQTANSRSGFANFRTAAKYHRARLTISGTFNAAQGLEYQAVPDGYT